VDVEEDRGVLEVGRFVVFDQPNVLLLEEKEETYTGVRVNEVRVIPDTTYPEAFG
jgi:hypothetical protein